MGERCELCREFVDWNNPNTHYGGHTCDIRRLDLLSATERFVRGERVPYNHTLPQNAEVNTSNGTTSLFTFQKDDATLLGYQTKVRQLEDKLREYLALEQLGRDEAVYQLHEINKTTKKLLGE
jgi:hypothetical protein